MRHVLLALPLLAACSSGLGSAPDGGPPAVTCALQDAGVPSSGLPSPVPGCSAPAGPTGVLDLAALGWGNRGGILVVPAAPPGAPLPVVFGFHGAGEDGENVRARLALEDPLDGGAIFIYPNASAGTWDIGSSSADSELVFALLDRLASGYCVDPARIYIAGFSAGAVFTLYLGCHDRGTFRAMAVVAGTDARFDRRCCQGALSAIFVHGTQDEAIPFTEGRAALAHLLDRDQCTSTSAADGLHCVAYACPAEYQADFCQWAGDHDVPDWAGWEIARFFSLLP